MTDVACFCGCCFSFDGAAGACPTCGQVARVTAGPVSGSAGHSWPEHPVPVMNGAGRNGRTPETCQERAEADAAALSGIAIGAIADDPETATVRRG
jgi:hypothetical protein